MTGTGAKEEYGKERAVQQNHMSIYPWNTDFKRKRKNAKLVRDGRNVQEWRGSPIVSWHARTFRKENGRNIKMYAQSILGKTAFASKRQLKILKILFSALGRAKQVKNSKPPPAN
jgi:hypothetical protein